MSPVFSSITNISPISGLEELSFCGTSLCDIFNAGYPSVQPCIPDAINNTDSHTSSSPKLLTLRTAQSTSGQSDILSPVGIEPSAWKTAQQQRADQSADSLQPNNNVAPVSGNAFSPVNPEQLSSRNQCAVADTVVEMIEGPTDKMPLPRSPDRPFPTERPLTTGTDSTENGNREKLHKGSCYDRSKPRKVANNDGPSTTNNNLVQPTSGLKPLSLELLHKNNTDFLKRVARAIEVPAHHLSLISTGSGGAVFEYHAEGHPPEAIKCHFGFNRQDPEPYEITVARSLQTIPGVSYAPVFLGAQYSQSASVWFHRMRLYPASLNDLTKRILKERLQEKEVRLLIKDLLQGIAEINSLGYMHRDIKPHNILLPQKTLTAIQNRCLNNIRPPLLVIADYGLAKPLESLHQDGRQTPDMCTYQYRPAYTHSENYGGEIDVSSAGMIFYELITGNRFINLSTEKATKAETVEQCQQRKDRDQQQLHTRIKEQLTGGEAFSKRSAGECRQHWQAMVEQAGYSLDQYPITQYLGLHRLIYGNDQWISIMQQQAQGTVLTDDVLSAQGFLALCDLLTKDSPHDAATQLQQPYWQEAPAGLSDQAQKLREENILGKTCDFCHDQDKKKYWPVKSYDRHVNRHKPCPVSGCNTTMNKKGLGILISHLKNHHSKEQLEALARRILRFKKDRIAPVSSDRKTMGKTQIWPLSDSSSAELNPPKVAGIELTTTNKSSPSQIDDGVNERLIGVYHKLSQRVCFFEVNGSVCGQLFKSPSQKNQHFRSHTGEKPFKCTHCDKRFSLKNILTEHMRIHTGEMPYECAHCNKRFSRKYTLTRHKIIHTGERPYECSYCNKRFSLKSNMTNHKKIHSGEKYHESAHCTQQPPAKTGGC